MQFTLQLFLLPCLVLIYLAAGLPFVKAASAPRNYESVDEQLDFLKKYGYISSTMRSTAAAELQSAGYSATLTYALMAYQRMVNIPITGQMDEKTKEMMSKPRCGNKDVYYNTRRRKRYALQGSKWPKTQLTWRVTSYSPDMDALTTMEQIRQGLNLWSIPTNLEFTDVQGGQEADIDIGFYMKDHGDGYPFDGPGGVLAHAFFPQFGGDIHIDDHETWTVDSNRGFNLLSVLAHEAGHSLGLRHSAVQDALMAPYYQGFHEGRNPNSILKKDDAKGIQEIYGARGSGGGGYNPSLCKPGEVDAIFNMRRYTYIFQGSVVIKLNGDDEVKNSFWPNSIQQAFPGGPSYVDAAFFFDNKIYLISGNDVYLFDNNFIKIDKRNMDTVFPDIANGSTQKVEAAFVFQNELYLFQGGKSYKLYRDNTSWKVTESPNMDLVWEIPDSCNKVTAALTWMNGRLYMFCQSTEYFRLTSQKKVDFSYSAPYPRSTAAWWFSCSSAHSNLKSLGSELAFTPPPTSHTPHTPSYGHNYNSGKTGLSGDKWGIFMSLGLVLYLIEIKIHSFL